MNLNEAFVIIIEYLISDAKNKEFISKLEIISEGLKNKSHVEEEDHPRYCSIILFGWNMFPFHDFQYLEMAKLIKG